LRIIHILLFIPMALMMT
jgi:multidrug resistance protein, MATE family